MADGSRLALRLPKEGSSAPNQIKSLGRSLSANRASSMVLAKMASSPLTGSFWYSQSNASLPIRARMVISSNSGRCAQLTLLPASISASWAS